VSTEGFGFFQIIYLVHDPPDWSCENGEKMFCVDKKMIFASWKFNYAFVEIAGEKERSDNIF
jgi:hypothetical protein